MKISLIGIGSMGQNHLRVLSEIKDIDLYSIYDLDKKKISNIAKKYKTKVAQNIQEISNNSDAIIIASPTFTHFKYIDFFLRKKKILFVEKPLVSNLNQANKLKKKYKNINLQCGFIERFNPIVPILKKIITKEKVICIEFQRTDKLSSRIKDVDVIHDLMIHDIDLSIFLNGKIKSLKAFGRKEKGHIVFATAILIHDNNIISKIEASRITQKKIRKINLTTLKSFVSANLLTKDIIINTQTNLKQKNKKYNPIVISSKEEKILVTPEEPLKNEILQFIRFCKSKKIKIPNFNESHYNLKICKKIRDEIIKNLS